MTTFRAVAYTDTVRCSADHSCLMLIIHDVCLSRPSHTVCHAGTCTPCYLLRRSGAAVVLAAANAGRMCHKYIDQLMFKEMPRHNELQIYASDPPLCDVAGMPSIING